MPSGKKRTWYQYAILLIRLLITLESRNGRCIKVFYYFYNNCAGKIRDYYDSFRCNEAMFVG